MVSPTQTFRRDSLIYLMSHELRNKSKRIELVIEQTEYFQGFLLYSEINNAMFHLKSKHVKNYEFEIINLYFCLTFVDFATQ